MITIERNTINVRGLETLYYKAGHGEPLVVIHGGAGDARTWLQNIEVLANNYTV